MVFICFPLSIAKMRLEASRPQRSSLPLCLYEESLCLLRVVAYDIVHQHKEGRLPKSPLRREPERKGSHWEAHFPACCQSAGNPCWEALGQVMGDRPSSAS